MASVGERLAAIRARRGAVPADPEVVTVTTPSPALDVNAAAEVVRAIHEPTESGPVCRSCSAPIQWRMESGKLHPYDRGSSRSHFDTCPQAASWRKAPPSTSEDAHELVDSFAGSDQPPSPERATKPAPAHHGTRYAPAGVRSERVRCSACGGRAWVDAETGAIVSHSDPPEGDRPGKRAGVCFGPAAGLL